MKIVNILSFSIILTACSNSNFTGQNLTSEAGANDSEAGSINNGGNAGSAGNINVSGSSSGGTSGSINSAGSGGLVNSAGVNAGGTGGVENNCKPITCDSYSLDKAKIAGLACGLLDDGCGNMLNCGTCADFSSCGANNYAFATVMKTIDIPPSIDPNKPAINNICGGQCIRPDSQNINMLYCTHDLYNSTNNYAYLMYCPVDLQSYPATDVPNPNCIKSTTLGVWCCATDM